MEQLQEAESEARALRSLTKRMILTQEEMVCFIVLKYNSYKMDSLLHILLHLSLGGSCPEEMLACSLLGFGCAAW